MDREIQRKMEEFGYYNSIEGHGEIPYILRDFNWVEQCFKNHKNGVEGGNANTSNCPI